MAMARITTTLALLAALSAPAAVAQDAGGYLAARSAMLSSDFDKAADYYARAIVRDPSNVPLLENAATAYLGLGDLDRAAQIARRAFEAKSENQLVGLMLIGDMARRDDWKGLVSGIDGGMKVGPLFDGLAKAWGLVGDGQMTEALTAFDGVASNEGVEAFGLYHKALALASVGDFEGAAELFSGESGRTIRVTRRGVVAYAEVLSQLERNQDALDLIEESFGASLDPYLETMRDRLAAGETLAFDAVRTPLDGLAEVYFSIASALRSEAQEDYTLIYTRMALALRPDHMDALLMTAELLESLGRFDLATQVYDTVPREDPAFHSAELGRAEALRQADREDAAIEVLRQLAKSHSELPLVHVTLGDTLRGMDRFAEAIGPYSDAIALIEQPEEQHWIIYFARGISYERTDEWEKAEADFRKALELRPEQPQVMNYLGYSYLEKDENYDEALELIERAVALRPDSGYIIDSLGWGLYRLGRYEEAVGHMEKAVERMAIDPIVNDHLGDVYWAVGRKREAQFQWQRALSFTSEDHDTGDVDADRIRRKIEVGLDKVLEEEGAPPLQKVANDG